MASIGDLMRVVAKVEDLEENFVSVYARAAREAGFITHKGRGRHAAAMTARDAANLLIAVNGAPLAKDAPTAISTYRNLKASRWGGAEKEMPTFVHDLLKAGITFGEALERLIELFITASYPDFPIYRALDLDFLTLDGVTVDFQRPETRASIEIVCTDARRELKLHALSYFEAKQPDRVALQGGRAEITQINAITLMAVGRTLAT